MGGSPNNATASAEDIASHLDDIEDLGEFSVPREVWDELREIGLAYQRQADRSISLSDIEDALQKKAR